jgi:hypothetical protein
MESSESLVVIGPVDRDVFHAILLERGHEFVKVFLTTFIPQLCGGEVAVHSGTIPVALKRFTVIVDVHTVFLAESLEKEASNPDLVCCALGTFTEDLELPLSHSYFGVDALVIYPGIEAEV